MGREHPDIVIVAQYLLNMEAPETSNSRFCYLADLLTDFASIEIVTTDFHHEGKRHFNNVSAYNKCKVTMLHEPGYPKNVCLQRFYSHWVLAKNVKRYLQQRKQPDLIYVAIPSLDVADVVSDYCVRNHVPLVIDIQDLWPEAFKMVVNIPVLTDIVYWPMTKKANKIYGSATEVIAVSKTYLQRGLSVNKKAKGEVVYLGTDKQDFDKYAQDVVKDQFNKTKLVYLGTLGHSYDLKLVFRALRLLDKNHLDKISMTVLGDGPKKKEFEQDAKGLPVVFMGRLDYGDMVRELVKCDIAINPIVSGAAQSIINKHMDYAMAGLPVINTQECIEYRELIDRWQCGINCRCGNAEDIARALEILVSDRRKRNVMAENSRNMGEKLFDRASAYGKFVQVIKSLTNVEL